MLLSRWSCRGQGPLGHRQCRGQNDLLACLGHPSLVATVSPGRKPASMKVKGLMLELATSIVMLTSASQGAQ
jgi:hypothetical protein